MEKKTITREKLVSVMAKFIKEQSKQMGDKTHIELPIEISNWSSGFGRNSKWAHTDIEIGEYRDKVIYTFTDKEITDEQFVYMLRKALEESKVRGQVFADVYGDGCWTPKQTIFRRVEIYAAPCKEFTTLAKLIQKYSGKTIGGTDVFHVSVCGKRSAWSDSSAYRYLCYEPNQCKAIIDTIRTKKTSKDALKVEMEGYFSHGDEEDYRCAMHMESEWYGCRGVKLHLTITTPSGRIKSDYKFGA
jgi:hypothetical protein